MAELKKETILNCSTKVFLKTINSLRHDVADYFKATKLNEIIYKSVDVPDNVSEDKRNEYLVDRYNERLDKIIFSCFSEDNIEKTYDILAKLSFDTVENLEKLDEMELVSLLMKMFSDSRTAHFFIMQQSTALLNSDG